jgi:CBS domain-containing protein
MKVKDIMTVNVAAIGQDATLKQAAELMIERGISGVPVINREGRVLGVLSETDFLPKAASRPESAGMIGLFASRKVDERHRTAVTAADAMTAPAVTVEADASIAEAARLMVDHDVSRLPVVLGGKLVGIVSGADVVRAFTRTDDAISEELHRSIHDHNLWGCLRNFDVRVIGGEVTIAGRVNAGTVADVIEALAWRVPGVVSVDSSDLTCDAVESRELRMTG